MERKKGCSGDKYSVSAYVCGLQLGKLWFSGAFNWGKKKKKKKIIITFFATEQHAAMTFLFTHKLVFWFVLLYFFFLSMRLGSVDLHTSFFLSLGK